MLDFYLNFFVEDEDNRYRRFTEHHSQFCYTEDMIKKIAEESGLIFQAQYGDMSFSSPSEREERMFFVFKKPALD